MSLKIPNFQLMAKPSGSVCNIDCSYCFYLEKEHLYPERKNRWKMDKITLENYVRKNITDQKADIIDFLWQGGEPTLLGIDFFQEAIRLQEKYRGKKQINNYFQTNGTNINDDWAIFLKNNNFLVGLSIDGDRISNDAHRLTRSGKSTFDDVIKGLQALQRHHVEFNTLTVVNAENVQRPLDVYRFLKRIGSRYMQFIPLVERRANQPDKNGLTLIQPDFSGQCHVESWSVPSSAWGHFLNTIFDEWAAKDLGSIFIMNFEQTMAKMAGMPSACVINEVCGGNLIVESNGDVYSCDHFVYPEHKLGNINHDDLASMVNSPQNISFGERKLTQISKDCLSCPVKFVCNGGCPKHRFMLSSDGKPNKHYLCSGFKIHLTHVLPKMQTILTMLRHQATPSKIRKELKIAYYRAHKVNAY
ncbi:anaerobic sulfatase maturase [Brenneria populi subsp. brevivirga]|uniref:anaerobic sulfatase maturase n=1 Tax=Brenneria populi TaxID=1505588 RepID=UPI002E19074A|nr:anaerobic sulfatase maturase [Brenneria populi subsp. brevivirga]